MDKLTRSNDRKVANLVNASGKASVIPNAFGLPAGKEFACPNATSFCERICYAGKLEKIYKGVKNTLVNNFTALLYADYLNGIDGMVELLDDMINDFVKDCDKRNADKLFRIHWDGDFFSTEYARAWAIVVKRHSNVTFWVYTRSFDTVNVLPYITGIDNLRVFLSADEVNISIANQRAKEYPGVFIATVADTFAEARATIIDSSRKSYPCPENKKSIPLISDKGSACARCGICVGNTRAAGDVLFSVKKR